MKYQPFDSDQAKECRRVKVRKDLAGGLIKTGTICYALHKFRIFVPKPDSGTPPTEVAAFDIGTSYFDAYLEELEPQKVPGAAFEKPRVE